MTKFIFEADIMIARWRRERRHFEVSDAVAAYLLSRLNAVNGTMSMSVEELKDLLNNRGEISTAVKIGGKREEVIRLLETMSISAWELEVPMSIDEIEDCGDGDERFDGYVRAYTVPDT